MRRRQELVSSNSRCRRGQVGGAASPWNMIGKDVLHFSCRASAAGMFRLADGEWSSWKSTDHVSAECGDVSRERRPCQLQAGVITHFYCPANLLPVKTSATVASVPCHLGAAWMNGRGELHIQKITTNSDGHVCRCFAKAHPHLGESSGWSFYGLHFHDDARIPLHL